VLRATYSLDLILCYFNLFPLLKKIVFLILQDNHCVFDEEIMAVVKVWVMNQDKDCFHRDITKLVLCWQKCIISREHYIGVT
jgi:hypothetical protein